MAPPTSLEPLLRQYPGPKPYAFVDDYASRWGKEYIGQKNLTECLLDGIPLRLHQVWKVFGGRIDFGDRGM